MQKLILAIHLAAAAMGADDGKRVDYLREVKPLLRAKCYACHGALKQEGSLRLDTAALARRGGDSGASLVARQPDDSLLIERICSDDESLRMPQEATPLSAAEIKLLTRWIQQGAAAPEDERPESDPRQHWAFQPLTLPVVPAVENTDWVLNPIDAFIAEEHERRGLVPSPPASPAQLLRRVYLDLVGVPPTRAELHAYLADTAPRAYERVVDRLLASPQYGERWGRHWMDVWRYSDWYGRRRVPDVLNSYGQIWRWRDWIIRSLNEDKGYDRMVLEMLAADEVAPGDQENIVATGFVVRNFYRWNYNTWMKDQIEHTAKAFLGLTLNCCHCHDHKYDPISNDEYFRFRAFFEPIEIRHDRVPGETDPGPYPKYEYGKPYKPITSGMVRIMDEKLDAETFVYTGGESRNVIAGRPPVAPGGPEILGGDGLSIEPVDLPPEVWYPGLQSFVQQEEIGQREQVLAAAQAKLREVRAALAAAGEARGAQELAELDVAAQQREVQRAEAELAAIRARVHADRVRYLGEPGDANAVAEAASLAERQAELATKQVELARAERAWAAARWKAVGAKEDQSAQTELQRAAQQRDAAQLLVEQAQETISQQSAEYTPLSAQYPQQSTGRRTALARWITNGENPLPPRVAANHIWLRHFGRALVETTENFGRNGDAPTHPKLLDWLAVQLARRTNDSGNQPSASGHWQMKRIHRLIVTSRTYRMRSGTGGRDHPNYEVDRDNKYLWRFHPARMEAEVIRDSMLHVSGELEHTIGGQEIDQKQGLTVARRSVYFEHHGEGRMQILDLFDAANPVDCYRRSTSVRPQQALALANSQLALQQGRVLARKLERELGLQPADATPPQSGSPVASSGDTEFVRAAFEQVLARPPTSAELQASVAFLAEQVDLFRNVASGDLAGGEAKGDSQSEQTDRLLPAATNPVTRARENLIQALLSHSDFVTVR